MNFNGKYKRTKVENYSNFLREIGAKFIMRKILPASTPTIDIVYSNDSKCSITTTNFLGKKPVLNKKTEVFYFCESFYSINPLNGNKERVVVIPRSEDTWEIRRTHEKTDDKEIIIIMKFTDDGIDVEYKFGHVISKQFYTRQ